MGRGDEGAVVSQLNMITVYGLTAELSSVM